MNIIFVLVVLSSVQAFAYDCTPGAVRSQMEQNKSVITSETLVLAVKQCVERDYPKEIQSYSLISFRSAYLQANSWSLIGDAWMLRQGTR